MANTQHSAITTKEQFEGRCHIKYFCTHKLNPKSLYIKQLRVRKILIFTLGLFNVTKPLAGPGRFV